MTKERRLLVERIADTLAEFLSLEFDNDGNPEYYLHLVDDGNGEFHFVNDLSNADETFTAIRDFEGEDMTDFYNTEYLEDKSFRDVCEDLASQVEEWKKNREREA